MSLESYPLEHDSMNSMWMAEVAVQTWLLSFSHLSLVCGSSVLYGSEEVKTDWKARHGPTWWFGNWHIHCSRHTVPSPSICIQCIFGGWLLPEDYLLLPRLLFITCEVKLLPLHGLLRGLFLDTPWPSDGCCLTEVGLPCHRLWDFWWGACCLFPTHLCLCHCSRVHCPDITMPLSGTLNSH